MGPIHGNSSTLVACMVPRITWSVVNNLCYGDVIIRVIIILYIMDYQFVYALSLPADYNTVYQESLVGESLANWLFWSIWRISRSANRVLIV